MTRVLLINPPSRHRVGYGEMGLYVPIGLLSVAAAIRDICDVRIFDAMFTECERFEVHGACVVGSSFDRIKAEIERYAPDIVGISASYSSNAGLAKIVGHLCREVDPGIRVVIGGADASVRHRFFLASGCCDACVVGEGEATMRRLVRRHAAGSSLDGIEGTAWREGEVPRLLAGPFIADLDDLPLPAYDLIDLPAYLEHPRNYKGRGREQRRAVSIVTSRGCPYSCCFCSIHLHMGKKYRSHSPEHVLAHMDHLIRDHDVRHFHFEDDNLTLDRRRFERLLEGFQRRGVTWEASNGIRVDALDHGLLQKMKEAGCIGAHLPIESGSQRTLTEIIGKNLSLEKVHGVVQAAAALGMRMSAFYVIGFPGETAAEIAETLELAARFEREHGITPILLYANPLEGTRLFDRCRREGLIDASLGRADYPPPTPAVLDEEPVYLPRDVRREELDRLIARFRSRRADRGFGVRAASWVRDRPRRWLRRLAAAVRGARGGAGRAGGGHAEREDALFPVRYAPAVRGGETRVGVGRDRARNGFCLLTNDRLDRGDRLRVRLDDPAEPGPIRAGAVVESIRRVREFPSLYYFEAAIRVTGEREPAASVADAATG